MKRTFLVALVAIAACKAAPVAPAETAAPAPAASDPAAPAPPPTAPVAQGHPRTDLIPREVLFGNPERTNVQLSPDGKHVSWLAPKDGVMNVFVAPVGKLDAAKPVTRDTARPIRTYFWSYDKRHLLYVQDTGGDENWHLFRTTIDGGEIKDLTPYAGARVVILKQSPRKPKTIVVGLNDRDKKVSDVYALDIATGKRTLLYENVGNYLSFELDHDLKLRLARRLSADGAGEWFVRKGTKWEPWQTVAFEDNDLTDVVDFDLAGKHTYMIDSRDRETAALYEVDIATKRKRLLVEDPQADVGGDRLVHPTKQKLEAVAITYERTRWHVLDPSIQQDLDAIGKLVEGSDFSVNSRSLDDTRWLVAAAADIAPPRYYLYDRTKRTGTFLFASQPAIPVERLSRMHPVIIKTRDGLDMVSYLTLPKTSDPDGDGRPTTPVPMVLWVHGGPWARDEWGFNRPIQLLADRGYAVLQVNFRGSTGFGKRFLNAGDRQWSKKMHDDLIDGVAWAIAQQIAPKSKICIGGGSYGGYATLVGLAMTPDVFACGVDIVGPSNISTLIAATPAYWKPMIARLHRRMGNPDDPQDKAALDAASPLMYASKIKRPLLIGQGANDPRVAQAESEQIVAAMQKHRLPVTYVVFPDEGHGFARPQNNIVFRALQEAFLSAHLGGAYLPLTPAELAASSAQIKTGSDGIPGLPTTPSGK